MSSYKDFLLEHYKEVNKHLREADRKRDVLLGIYSAFVLGTLRISRDIDVGLKILVLTGTSIVGIIVLIVVTRFRGWHTEYMNVSIAIHKFFKDESQTLEDVARELKNDEINFVKYFAPKGVEFIMFLLTLTFWLFPVLLLCFTLYDNIDWLRTIPLFMYTYLVIIALAAIYMLGIWVYRSSLLRRERAFPESAWCIIKKSKKGSGNCARIVEKKGQNTAES